VARSIALRTAQQRIGSDARGTVRRDIAAAVRHGEAFHDPGAAALAAVHAAQVLRRYNERSAGWPFGRDFALVGAVAALLVFFTGASWTARVGLLLLTLAVLVAVELAVDVFIARRRENAARSERDNLAVVLKAIAARHHALPAGRARPLALPRASGTNDARDAAPDPYTP
jgi:hypothetical protein